MLSTKEREDRGRSIRAHILAYIKTGRLGELDKAMAELQILINLEEIAGSRTDIPDGRAWSMVSVLAVKDLDILTEAAVRGDDNPHAPGSVAEAADRLGTVLRALPVLDDL